MTTFFIILLAIILGLVAGKKTVELALLGVVGVYFNVERAVKKILN